MKKLSLALFIFSSSLFAQVQLGKNVQIGFGSGTGAGTVAGGTTGQFAQYPASGTTVQGATLSGDGSLAVGGDFTLSTVNNTPGTCGDSTHIPQFVVNGKGLTTSCTQLSLPTPFAGSNGIVFNTSTTTSRNAIFSDIVPLWGGGTCAGYLKSDGTCDVPAGSPSVGTAGTVQASDGSGAFAAATAANIGAALSPLYTSTNYGFGDSTLDGVGCDVYANCFFGLLTAAHGGPSVNLGFGGQMASWTVVSMATNLNPGFITTAPQYSVLDDIGINDAGGCGGTNTLCQQNYSAEQNAAVAISELTGTTYQTLAPACTLTGTWTSDTASFAGGIYIGKTSSTNGDSMSCSITTMGNPIALEYVVHNSDAGTANCRVDSGSYQNINFFPYITLNNPVFTLFRSAEIPAAAGTHTLNCIVTSSTSASNPVEFIAVDSVPVGQTKTLPLMVMTNVISAGGTNDTASQDISDLVLPIVTAYQAEGANIVYADIRTPTNFPELFSASQPGCPTNTLNSSGGLHPNDCGHAAIAAAIMAAAPNLYQTNMGAKTQGVAQGPFQAWGQPITRMQNSSGQSGGNFSASFTTGINPGGWCVYANTCMLFANTGTQIVPGYSTNQPVLMLGTPNDPICLTGIPNIATLNSQMLPMRNCWSGNGDYYMYFPTGGAGNPVGSFFHPYLLSRDNQTASSGNTLPPFLGDVTYIGPLTTSMTIALGGCKTSVANPESVWQTIYRHGTDGNTITFVSSSSNGDNINGGSTGNSFVWTATEGDKLTFQCSSNAVGGSYWTASVSTTDASAITAGTLADARLSSNVPLLNASNTFTGSTNTFSNGVVNLNSSGLEMLAPAATSVTPTVDGDIVNVHGSYWNGSASVDSFWTLRNVIGGSGAGITSKYTFTQPSSCPPGGCSVAVPAFQITKQVVNDVGLQIATGAGCTISAGAIGGTCTGTVTLPVIEPDTSYNITGCSVVSPASGPSSIGGLSSLTTTGFTFTQVALGTASTGGGTVECTVTHN